MVVDTRDRGLVAVGEAGVRLLEPVLAGSSALVDGTDPVPGLGPRAAEDLARAARLPCTGDLMVVSAVTPSGHVHAFEGQVGSHGGLGGAQSWPFLLHPVEWAVDESDRTDVAGRRVLVGAEPGARSSHEVGAVCRGAPMTRPGRSTSTSEPGVVRITWLGHASAVLDVAGVRVLTDPLLRRHAGLLRRRGGAPAPAVWSGADVVLLSHLHHDHAEPGFPAPARRRPGAHGTGQRALAA